MLVAFCVRSWSLNTEKKKMFAIKISKKRWDRIVGNSKRSFSKRVRGVYCPITTPLNEREEIDEKRLSNNVKYLLGTQVEGIVALGSTGEFASLSFEEKKRAYSVVSQSWKEEGKKEKTLIADVGSNCAKEVGTLTEEASSLGFRYAMVLTPHY